MSVGCHAVRVHCSRAGTQHDRRRNRLAQLLPHECYQSVQQFRDARHVLDSELIVRELDRVPERDLDKLLAFVRSISGANSDAAMPTKIAETSLAKDWLNAEEDAAWADL